MALRLNGYYIVDYRCCIRMVFCCPQITLMALISFISQILGSQALVNSWMTQIQGGDGMVDVDGLNLA